jgi:hypothetical protein
LIQARWPIDQLIAEPELRANVGEVERHSGPDTPNQEYCPKQATGKASPTTVLVDWHRF